MYSVIYLTNRRRLRISFIHSSLDELVYYTTYLLHVSNFRSRWISSSPFFSSSIHDKTLSLLHIHRRFSSFSNVVRTRFSTTRVLYTTQSRYILLCTYADVLYNTTVLSRFANFYNTEPVLLYLLHEYTAYIARRIYYCVQYPFFCPFARASRLTIFFATFFPFLAFVLPKPKLKYRCYARVLETCTVG